MAAVASVAALYSDCGDSSRPPEESPARLIWHYASDQVCRSDPPAFDGQRIYVPFNDGKVRAFDASGGGVRWTTVTGGSYHDDIAVFDGRLFVQTTFGTTALAPSTGSVLWTASDSADFPWGILSYDSVNSVVVSGGYRRSVWGLRASDGTPVWRVDVGEATLTTLIVGRTAYVGTTNSSVPPADAYGHLAAIDLDSRTIRWSFLAPRLQASSGFAGRLASAGGLVLGIAASGTTYAVDVIGGGKVWQFDRGALGGGPIADGRLVYVPSNDGHLYALDLHTGAQVWSAFFGGGSLYTEPAFFGDSLVLVKVGPTLYAVERVSGRTAWTYSLRYANICATPLVVGDAVVLAAEDGVYLLRVER